jgi:hypothetical protein
MEIVPAGRVFGVFKEPRVVGVVLVIERVIHGRYH